MSTLKADTIQSTGGGAATLTKQQAAKVIFCMDLAASPAVLVTGVGGAINTSSLVDNGTGDGTVSYTNNLGGRLNPVSHDSTGNTGGGNIYDRRSQVVHDYNNGFSPPRLGSLTSSIRIHSFYNGAGAGSAGLYDYGTNYIVIHGDLA
jgi:hypothetical protein